MLDELVPLSPAPDVLNYSWLDYGNRVGAWRILELCRALELPLTVLVNSRNLRRACPELVAAFRDAGCEIAAHGRTNAERQGQLPEAEERRLIAEATAEIARHEGKPPRGWLGPWISESDVTPDLLKEAGYDYVLDWCHDDRPVALATRAGPLLVGAVSAGGERRQRDRGAAHDGGGVRGPDRRSVRRDAGAGTGHRAGVPGVAASARQRPTAPAAPFAPRLCAYRAAARAHLAGARRRHRATWRSADTE